MTNKYVEWFKKEIRLLIEEKEVIVEQSKSLSKAEDDITSIGEHVVEHLLRVLIFGPNCPSINHWLKEINAWLMSIKGTKLKLNNKPVSMNYVKKWATERLTDENDKFSINKFQDVISAAIFTEEDYTPVATKLVENNFEKFISLYLNLLKGCTEQQSYNKEYLDSQMTDWFNVFSKYYN